MGKKRSRQKHREHRDCTENQKDFLVVNNQPFISVIIPVYNGEKFLPVCLDAVRSGSYQHYELIVVDDCSTDRSPEISREKGALVLKNPRQTGPGGARNLGAQQARGEVLFFVDADCVVKPDTLERVAKTFVEYPDVAATFGSYDEEPAEANFISQYKNLFHRFVHQQGRVEAETFWAGCGAMRRDVFLSVNGFDAERYPRPAIEDIELGYRLRARGHRILLDKQLQAKHLKRWTMKSMLHADIFCRAVPWSMLMFEHKDVLNDLNVQTTDRISAALLGLSLLLLPFSILKPQLLLLILVLLALIPVLNHKLYRYFIRRKGLLFAIIAFPLHLFYYFYSSATFVLCWLKHNFGPKKAQKAQNSV
jgi:glycosyltransferase involved in cell wall biosynthesis